MPITADDLKDLIIAEIGDLDPATLGAPSPGTGLLEANIDAIWDRYAAKDQVAPGLRAAYTRRDCIRLVRGAFSRRAFDVSDVLAGLTMKAGQIWAHLQDMHQSALDEIAALERKYAGSATIAGGPILRRAPITPAAPPDGNNRRYGGDLYGGDAGREVTT